MESATPISHRSRLIVENRAGAAGAAAVTPAAILGSAQEILIQPMVDGMMMGDSHKSDAKTGGRRVREFVGDSCGCGGCAPHHEAQVQAQSPSGESPSSVAARAADAARAAAAAVHASSAAETTAEGARAPAAIVRREQGWSEAVAGAGHMRWRLRRTQAYGRAGRRRRAPEGAGGSLARLPRAASTSVGGLLRWWRRPGSRCANLPGVRA